MDRRSLTQAILELDEGPAAQLEDAELAHALGVHLKPYIDRLEDDGPAQDNQPPRPGKAESPPLDLDGEEPDLASLPAREQARWIFMDRFIPLERHEEILSLRYQPEEFEEYNQIFEEFIGFLTQVPAVENALAANDVKKLQKLFASFVLLFRSPGIGADGQVTPTTLDALRNNFPGYFYKRKRIWYERLEFFHTPIERPRWVLCDCDILNCTLRKPDRRLASYAKNWAFPPELVLQKTVLEDIYDRILCGEALDEHIFARNYNSCTATTYTRKKGQAERLVYTVQRDQQISLHGKNGLPHWRASRRLWPGVLPSLTFPR